MTNSPASRTPCHIYLLQPRNRVRCFFLQWDFRLGSAAVYGQVSGPLGGVGSGPQVEKMVGAMDSWNGLCLDYMYGMLIGASTLRPISKRMDKSSRLVVGRFNLWLKQEHFQVCSVHTSASEEYHVRYQRKSFHHEVLPCVLVLC